jgi:RNA polymerase sigma-70 factor (ECF subfamily)
MPAALDAWFASEILIHEEALLHYLRRAWPRQDEVHDLRQEVYVRVYEAAGKQRPLQPRAFLFSTARHLLIDRVRRGRVVSIEPVGDFEPLNVLMDEVSPERWCAGRQGWPPMKSSPAQLGLIPGQARSRSMASR